MRVQIVTCNNTYENGKYKESYHEIHEIDNLRSMEHIVATVNSIISNNKLFKGANDTLESVIISGSDNMMIDKVISFFTKYSSSVSIMGAETAMLEL